MNKTAAQSMRVDLILTKNIIDKYANKKRKTIITAWREYMAEVRAKRDKIIKMGMIFKNYHIKPSFAKYKQNA